jgi:hypothetical protein
VVQKTQQAEVQGQGQENSGAELMKQKARAGDEHAFGTSGQGGDWNN